MTPLKPTAVLAFLLLFAAPFTPSAAELTPDSRVSEVTVYRQSVLVTREASLTLAPGSHRIVLKGLPCVADPDSMRASGKGSAGIEIGGVEVQQEFRQPDLTPEYRQIQTELEELDGRQAAINGERATIGTLREYLAGLKIIAGPETSKEVLTKGFAVESWQKAFDFFSSRSGLLSDQERALDAQQKELTEKATVARGRLSKMASQTGIQRWNAAVLVSARTKGEMVLRLSYLATNATWQPLYDARLDPATERVSLAWQAQVMQTTGEDWKDVGITLATTRPSAGIDLPVLASQQIHTLVAQNGRGGFVNIVKSAPVLGRNYEDALSMAPGIADRDGDEKLDIADAGEIEVITAGASANYATVGVALAQAARREVAVTFALPGRYDVPSDGQPHKHLIAERDMEAKVEHKAVPQISPAVFLVATVRLPGEVPLLPGKVQHFVGSDLVGSSTMVGRAAGEEFPLSFGPDDRLVVERKRLSRKVERRGKDDEITYRFVTSLQNHLVRDGVVEVKDRIPASDDARAVVTLDDDETTRGAVTDPKEPGILTWKVPIPKGGKQEIELTYRVRSPRGVVVAGLE